MNIGQWRLQLPTQQQSSPIMSGANQSAALFAKLLANKKSRATLPYAGPQAAANLQHTQLGNQYYGPQAMAHISLEGAQANEANQTARGQGITNQYLPQTLQAKIGQIMAMTNYYNMGGGHMNEPQKNNFALQFQIHKDYPNLSTGDVSDAASQLLLGKNNFSDGRPLPPITGQMMGILNKSAKDNTTANVANQRTFARNLDALFKKTDPLMPGATRFAGVLGKFKGKLDAAKASLGTNTKDYSDYMKFTRNALPQLASELSRMEGMHGTDKQKLAAYQSLNPISLDTNPALGMDMYNYMKDLTSSIEDQLNKSAYQIYNPGANSGGDSSNTSGSSASSNSSVSSNQPVAFVWQNGKLVKAS